MNAAANIGVRMRMLPPHSVASQENTFTPAGWR
jgi:hypothetical protein